MVEKNENKFLLRTHSKLKALNLQLTGAHSMLFISMEVN